MLEDAEIFVSVVENKSFSKAARQLNLSASIVTRHIARLEKNMKVRILQRNTRQLSLTEPGLVFYESCKILLETYNITLKQVANLSNEIIGTLKIGLPSSISHLHITNKLNDFLNKYPLLKIEIVTGNHLIDLLSNGFDFIIHCGELSDSNLYSRKLGVWKKITCASPHYFERFGTPKHPDDLKKYNCLDHYDNRDNCWEYIINNEVQSVSVKGNIKINSSIDLKNIAVSGLGIVYLPSFSVKSEIECGSLKEILTPYQVSALNVYAVYPSNRFLNRKVTIFLDFLSSLDIFM